MCKELDQNVMSAKSSKVSFEDALTMTGWGRFNIWMLLVCGSIVCAMGFETTAVAYLVPASACELNTTSAQQGIMAGIPLIGVLVSSNIWGYLADTRGRRRIVLIELFITMFTASAASFSSNWIVFSVLRFLSSSSMASCYALANTFLSECTLQRKRFFMVQMLSTMFLTSSGLMAALTVPIVPLTFSYHIPFLGIYFNSWRVLNLVFCIPTVVAFVLVYLSYESPKFLLSVGKDEEAVEVLRKIYLNNHHYKGEYGVTSVYLDEEISRSTKGFWSSVVTQTTPLLKPPLIWTTILLSVLFVCVYMSVNPHLVWMPYMMDRFMKSLDKGDVGLSFCQMFRSAQGINDTISSVEKVKDCSVNSTSLMLMIFVNLLLAGLNSIFAILLQYFSRKSMFIGLQLTAGVCGILMNVSTEWRLSAVLFIAFFSAVLNFGTLNTFSTDLFPTYVKAMAVCVTLMVGRGSAVFGINLQKDLLEHNCEMGFYVFGGITLLGGIIGFLLPWDKKIKEVKSIEN